MFNKNCHKSTINDMFAKTDSYTCGLFRAYYLEYKPNTDYTVWLDNCGCLEVSHNAPEGSGPEVIYSASGLDSLTEYELLMLALGAIKTYLL